MKTYRRLHPHSQSHHAHLLSPISGEEKGPHHTPWLVLQREVRIRRCEPVLRAACVRCYEPAPPLVQAGAEKRQARVRRRGAVMPGELDPVVLESHGSANAVMPPVDGFAPRPRGGAAIG